MFVVDGQMYHPLQEVNFTMVEECYVDGKVDGWVDQLNVHAVHVRGLN